MDLFGDSHTTPTTRSIPRDVENAAAGFAEFWKAWPSGPRKVGKPQALDKWARYGCAKEAQHIAKHVEWLKTQDDWLRGFVPMPCTYLNQRRWLDWEAPIERPKKPDALALIKAHKGSAPPPEVREKMAAILRR